MVLFQNRQWAVTDVGLEAVKPGAPCEYLIPAKRLLESKGGAGEGLYDWPWHLAEKTWIDLEAFIEAYRKALEVHKGKYPGTVDQKTLEATIKAARRRLREQQTLKASGEKGAFKSKFDRLKEKFKSWKI